MKRIQTIYSDRLNAKKHVRHKLSQSYIFSHSARYQVGFLRENLRNYRLTTASILRGGVYCMRRANKQ